MRIRGIRPPRPTIAARGFARNGSGQTIQNLSAKLHSAPILVLIVAFTLLRGVIWAFLIPPLDAPDEPSHLIAVAQVRAMRGLPVAILLDPNTLSQNSTPRPAEVLAYLAQPRFHYTHFRALSYEATQPPIYYLLGALLTAPLPNDPQMLLYGGRLVSVLLGALTVFAAGRAAVALAPDQPGLVVGVPLGLALWPQFAFQSAILSNDIALDLAGALLAWGWAAAARTPGWLRPPLLLGALTGLGLLCKLTVIATLPATALILVGRALDRSRAGAVLASRPAPFRSRVPHAPGAPRAGGWRTGFFARLALQALLATGMVAALVGPWVVRNLRTYGEPTGAAQMFSVIHGIYTERLHLPHTTRIIVPPLGDFLWYSFTSFWAVFGWRGLFLATPFYVLAGALTALGLGGAVAWLIRRVRVRAALPFAQTLTLAAYALTAGAAVVSYLIYTVTTDGSLQGRYTFVALVPFVVIGAGGILHATPRPTVNRVLGGVALAALALLQIASSVAIAQSLARFLFRA